MRIDGMRLESHFHLSAHGPEYCGEIVHAGIAVRRQHAMKALRWFLGQLGEFLEAEGGIDEVAQDDPVVRDKILQRLK